MWVPVYDRTPEIRSDKGSVRSENGSFTLIPGGFIHLKPFINIDLRKRLYITDRLDISEKAI